MHVIVSTFFGHFQPFYCRYVVEILPDFGQLMPYLQRFSTLLPAVVLVPLYKQNSAKISRVLSCSYGVVSER